MDSTLPARVAEMAVFIFIASNVISLSPCWTSCPTETWISTTVPESGLTTSLAPAATVAAAGADEAIGEEMRAELPLEVGNGGVDATAAMDAGTVVAGSPTSSTATS